MREWARMTTWEGALGFDVANLFNGLSEKKNNCSEAQQEIDALYSAGTGWVMMRVLMTVEASWRDKTTRDER